MHLSYELFKQIVDQLRADGRDDGEKRVEPRVGLSAEASLVMGVARGQSRPATSRIMVRDISRSGVGLVTTERMPLKRNIMIELPSSNGTVWIICTTVYCEPLDSGLFKIGARHSRVLGPDDVQKITAQMQQNSSPKAAESDRIRVTMLQ